MMRLTADQATLGNPVCQRRARRAPIARATAQLERWISGLPFLVNLYARFYRDVIESEISLAQIKPGDSVLNVGCGPAPFTALLLARRTEAAVTCMDRDRDAADRAQRLAMREGLQGRVHVLVGDATRDVPPFDVAVVALQVAPKLDVLKSLAAHSSPTARLVVREPATWCEDMYDRLPASYIPRAEVRHHMGALNRSALYWTMDIQEGSREEC